jgi:signal transduction histidine kinase
MNETGLLHIVLVEDNPGDARLLRELLREAPSLRFELTHVERLGEARQRLQKQPADVVLLDLSLPDAHGMETVTGMLEAAGDAPIIVLTGLDDETTALKAVQAGAQDYLVKGNVDGALLGRAIRYAVERKRLELERMQLLDREREARSVAEQAVQARDEVLRVVAHDLGNSLSAVLVTTQVLLRILPARDDTDPIRQHVENVRSLVEQMQRLRRDLLDVTMLEAGRLSMDPRAVDPSELIQASLERYAPLATEKGIELQADLTKRLPVIRADGSRIAQVAANLLTNALKFTGPGGKVLFGATAREPMVCFFVSDTGPGIAPDDLPYLFDRFWTTRKGNPYGAGLGLAIAKGIVEAHGGSIWTESELGNGATFFFTVPIYPSASRS